MQPTERSPFSYFRSFAEEDGAMPFLGDGERQYSACEAFGEAVALANFFARAGIAAQTGVALCARRSLDGCMIFYALFLLGAEVILCDPHGDPEEEIRASGVPIPYEFVIRPQDGNGWTLSGGGKGERFSVCRRSEEPHFPTETDGKAPAAVIFTSGSTGTCKAVVLSRYGILNHCENHFASGVCRKGDVSMDVLPIHHAFGISLIVTALVARYCLRFPEKTDCGTVLHMIEREKITHLEGVPSLYCALAETNLSLKRDTSSLRTGMVGGAPVTEEQIGFIERSLGVRLIVGYGMSEYIGITTGKLDDPPDLRARSVGKFEPMNRGYILGEDGAELKTGEVGEICVSGPSLMLGYFGNETETRRAIDGEGRLHTADLGYLDEAGYVHITGRKKEIIIRNGVNLSPRRIEEAIMSLPEVFSAAVVGLPHEKFGEAPAALVMLREGAVLSEEDLLAHLKGILHKNELPEQILFGQIPLTSTGKPDKPRIRELRWKA